MKTAAPQARRSASRRKTRRGRLVEARGQEVFPGMPDRVAKKPPKADAEPVPMTLDQAIARYEAAYQASRQKHQRGEEAAA